MLMSSRNYLAKLLTASCFACYDNHFACFQHRVVKLSSPYLNVLIVVGVIMYYIDIILFGVDEGTPASRCTVNALCMVSHTYRQLCYGKNTKLPPYNTISLSSSP